MVKRWRNGESWLLFRVKDPVSEDTVGCSIHILRGLPDILWYPSHLHRTKSLKKIQTWQQCRAKSLYSYYYAQNKTGAEIQGFNLPQPPVLGDGHEQPRTEECYSIRSQPLETGERKIYKNVAKNTFFIIFKTFSFSLFSVKYLNFLKCVCSESTPELRIHDIDGSYVTGA